MANSGEAIIIDVDADAAADVPPSPRIVRGTGNAAAPLELASSDSEDESPAKRAKQAPAGPPSPSGNALCAQLRREREARRPPRPVAPPPPPRQTSIETFELSAAAQSARDVPGHIDRGFTKIVDGVLTATDATKLIQLAAQKGYKVATIKGQTQTPAARQKALLKRNGLRCIVKAPRLADKIFDRLRPFLPARKRDEYGAEWRLLGLNECLRFLKYKPGMFFKQHPDGAHPSRHAVPRRSFITLLLYLNEGYTGGHTTIWNAVGGQFGPWSDRPGRPRTDPGIAVPPRIGMALVHDHILLHESPELRVGVKHVIRTDVMYERVR